MNIGLQWWGRTEYFSALERMNMLQKQVAAGHEPSVIVYTEHMPVITCGRSTPEKQVFNHLRIPVAKVPRGGLATWHGPGQLVGYPVINLKELYADGTPDLHSFLRHLEYGLIDFLSTQYCIQVVTRPGFTGVWILNEHTLPRKIASIGISVKHFVTAHGFALNVNCDMSGFHEIVPCGLADIEMTSIQHELALLQRPTETFDLKQISGDIHPFLVKELLRP